MVEPWPKDQLFFSPSLPLPFSLFSIFPSLDHLSGCQHFLKLNEDLPYRRHLRGILLLVQLYSPLHFSPSSLIHLDI